MTSFIRLTVSTVIGMLKGMDLTSQRSPVHGFYYETGRLIKAARTAKGITQANLAPLVRLSRTAIANIERGRQRLLLDTFLAISSALGVSPMSLLPTAIHEDQAVGQRIFGRASKKERDWMKKILAKDKEWKGPHET